MWLSLLASYMLLGTVSCWTKSDDSIETLPGLKFRINFQQFSGYLNVTKEHLYRYWLVKCQKKLANVPLILWLNGGPGCTSIGAVFAENGPFRLDKTGTKVSENLYSWNKVADVLYIDSYAGVGFSYNGDNATFSDTKTARENHQALKIFFQKFPEYEGREFYITGQSYAGIYIPTLAAEILKDNDFPANFAGIAIGNGVFQHKLLGSSRIDDAFQKGCFSPNEWLKLRKVCNCGHEMFCNYFQKGNWNYERTPKPFGKDACTLMTLKMYAKMKIGMGKTSTANFYSYCYTDSAQGPDCVQFFLHFESLYENYFNRHEVRKAIHIPSFTPKFKYCSNSESYKSDVSANEGVYSYVQQIIKAKKRILYYYGDTDSTCPVIHAEAFIANLTAQSKGRTPWTYEKDLFTLAGFWENFPQLNLDFLTVRGAGHLVTMDKPRENRYK